MSKWVRFSFGSMLLISMSANADGPVLRVNCSPVGVMDGGVSAQVVETAPGRLVGTFVEAGWVSNTIYKGRVSIRLEKSKDAPERCDALITGLDLPRDESLSLRLRQGKDDWFEHVRNGRTSPAPWDHTVRCTADAALIAWIKKCY